MISEAQARYVKADKKLNKVYQQLLVKYKSNVPFIKNLKTAQRLWIKLRDVQLTMKYPESLYSGSSLAFSRVNYLIRLTEKRTRDLKQWLDTTASTPSPNKCEDLDRPDLADGLVAFYPFNGNAIDISGNDNNGTVNGATLVANRLGRPSSAYSFSGQSNWITIPNSPSIDITGPISICGWLKASSNDSFMVVLGKDGDYQSGQRSWHVGIYKRMLRFSPNTPNLQDIYSNPFPDGFTDWTQFAVTYDLSTVKFYINGKLNASVPCSGRLNSITQPLRIGVLNPEYPGYWYFDGVLDDIRIYNRILSLAEIQALYQEHGWGQ